MTELRKATEATLDEGERRLTRSWPMLLATGTVGGIDVGMGVFALLLVEEATRNPLLGALAFSIGFIALTMANSELFTENFLVPVAAVSEGRARLPSVFRLWGGTLVTNLVGGWIIMLVVMQALPQLAATAVRLGTHFTELGIGWRSLASAILGGTIITLMTWMERSTDSMPARLLAAVSAAFVLAAGSINHAIVMSLEMFAALQVGAPFGYGEWLPLLAWASFGNMVGGLALVTVLRVAQMRSELRSGQESGRGAGRAA